MEKREVMKEQWRKQMQENEALQKFFSGYTPHSVTSFIDHIITWKQFWLDHGPGYVDEMQTDGVKWVYTATRHLEYIQQKKLFDLQCQWRAEQVKIEGIELCCDFTVWEKNILNCPFLEPITADDIELYAEYLLQLEDDPENESIESWQDYDDITESYSEGSRFIEWYEFYNMRRGTGVLMQLPNIRGEKEEFYKDLLRKKNNIGTTNVEKTEVKKYLHTDKAQVRQYVYAFEDKDTQLLYDAFEFRDSMRNKQEDMEFIFEMLFAADEKVPIEAHSDWREAVKNAAHKYRSKKIAAALPAAWEQYMMNVQMGIAFRREQDGYEWLKEMETKNIIEGRVLNGEPADLNF